MRLQYKNGFTIIELLVVLGTLSLILLAMVSFLMSSLSSSGKAEAVKEVRQNGDAVLKMVRTLVTSSSQVISCTADVPETVPTEITFTSNNGSIQIECVDNGTDSYIASNSARLTDQGVVVSDCSLYCLQPPGGLANVYVSFTLSPAGQSGMKDSEKVNQKFETVINVLGI